MASLISDTPSVWKCQLYTHLTSSIARNLSWKITSQEYQQVLTQLASGYEFFMRDDGSCIWLKMKAISPIPWWTNLIGVHWAMT